MKPKKMLITMIASYLCFLLLSFLLTMLLVPHVLQHYLHGISSDPTWQDALHGASVAIQNTCYIMVAFVMLLSLIPFLAIYFKLYRPLRDASEAAARYMEEDSTKPEITYDRDDELGRLTATLKYLSESAGHSNEYQRKFISNISHDFRSPLTSIKGYVEAMLDGTISPEMQDRYLGIVLSETERLNKLTEGLLLLNSFDDQRIYLDLTEFDISEVIRHTLDTFEVLCQKKNLAIRTDLPDEPLIVCADMGRIQQVLYNLIDNAIKFSHHNSTIYIQASGRYEKIFVSVKDTGIGIPKDSQKKIWERFYKTVMSRGKDKKGTGLGLSIVKEIIQSHGENIDVVSTEGVGTEFIFSLPRSTNL